MRECYFCGKKDYLKSIYLESDIENADESDPNLEHLPERSCCMNCFNDPDNGMEESPVSSTDWFNTDYDWILTSPNLSNERIKP